MGNNRNLIVLGVVLVVLVGAYLLTRDRRPELDETGGFEELVETELSTDDVYTLELLLGGDPSQGFVVVQRDDEWFVSSHYDAPANLNKIRTLLGNLETVSGEPRSDDAGVLDAYALDDSSAYHVRILGEGGDPMLELLIGERSGQGCFVRRPGSNRVLLADHNFLSDFGVWGDERPAPKASSWIDLVAFEVERDEVRTIEIRGDEQTVVMTKEFVETEAAAADTMIAAGPEVQDPNAYEWRVTAPSDFVASKTRADGVLNAITNVRARDVVGDALEEDLGLGDDARSVVVTLADGTSHSLYFGETLGDDDSLLYFRVEDEALVWSLPEYVANNVFKTEDDLRAES